MDFIDKMKALQSHVEKQAKIIEMDEAPKEEATKSALVLPFINDVLGYDVRNLNEVRPEYSIDNAGKKDQRVDYAILKEGKPIILIECKCCTEDLAKKDIAQLKDYYPNIEGAKFGILTNGIKYKFYTDLEKVNILDEDPFLELDVLNIKEPVIAEVKNFAKPTDIDSIYTTAQGLKYKEGIKKVLEREFDKPSEEFVKFFAGQVYERFLVKGVIKQFEKYTKNACDEFIQSKIDDSSKGKDWPSFPETVIGLNGLKCFIFNGERYEVRFWKEMLPKVCTIMASRHKDRFEAILTIKGDKHTYFSRNRDELKSPELIEGTDIYVRTDFHTGMLLHVSKRVITLFDYPEDIISFGEDQE
jgi:hypothetical protein